MVAIKVQLVKDQRPFPQKDNTSLENLQSISKFLQDVIMMIVLNDLKYFLCNYIMEMQNALVEEDTRQHQQLVSQQVAVYQRGQYATPDTI